MAKHANYAGPPYFAHLALACPACFGAPVALGGLGSRFWFRCEDCGLDFDVRAEDAAVDVMANLD